MSWSGRGLHLARLSLLGPISRSRPLWRVALAFLLVGVLTLASQTGGLALWLAYGVGEAAGRRRGAVVALAFVLIHACLTVLVLPRLAPLFGRVPLACVAGGGGALAAISPLYCALNRNYVQPGLREAALALTKHVARRHPGSVVTYLDAGFPLPLAMPLLPHLSHRHGRSLDIALFYRTAGDAPRARGGAWWFGYWAFAPARRHERQVACQRSGPLRWEMQGLQGLFTDLRLDRVRTAELLAWLDREGRRHGIDRVYIEPYLERHLGFASDLMRHAGCAAARHDDHLHLRMRP